MTDTITIKKSEYDNMLKNKLNIIYNYNNRHCCKLKLNEPSNTAFVFQFPNGDKVECPDCKSLQDFIDKLNRYAEVKEENAKLKGLLKECQKYFEQENQHSFTSCFEIKYELLTKIEEALK